MEVFDRPGMVVCSNDRFLRGITTGQGPAEKNMTRKTAFNITVSSEIMAVRPFTSHSTTSSWPWHAHA